MPRKLLAESQKQPFKKIKEDNIMGLRINTNVSALNTHRQLKISDSALAKSLERLSSGFRINKAADDAAGLAVSQRFRADLASFAVASRNTTEATALLQVAEGAADQIGNMLTRLKELATQAASANANDNLATINSEQQKVLDEINRIANSTSYGNLDLIDGTFGVGTSATGTALTAANGFESLTGMKQGYTYLLNVQDTAGDDSQIRITAYNAAGATAGMEEIYGWSGPSSGTKDISFNSLGVTLTVNSNISNGTAISGATAAGSQVIAQESGNSTFQVGTTNDSNDQIAITLDSMLTTDLGIHSIGMDTADNARNALTSIDAAISNLSSARANIGAYQNRLSFAAANLSTTIENMSAANSVIRDVDMAAEMTEFTKSQILMQSGTAMLAQANLSPQLVLSLIG
jgi:flagellin